MLRDWSSKWESRKGVLGRERLLSRQKRVLRPAAAAFPFRPGGASLPPPDCPLPSWAPPASGRPSIALSAPPAIGCLRPALDPQLRSELPGRLLRRPKMSTANDRAVLRSLFHPNAPFGAALAEEDPPTGPEEEEAFDPALLRQARALETAGVAAAEAGDVEGALERFDRAIRLLPERASAYNNRAQALRLKGDVAGALEDLEAALGLSGGTGRAARQGFVQRGLIRRLQGRPEEARRDFEEAARLGSLFAQQQLVLLNPYAALCNRMLARAVQGLRGPLREQEQD